MDQFPSLNTSNVAGKKQNQSELLDINNDQQSLPHFPAPIAKLPANNTIPVRS